MSESEMLNEQKKDTYSTTRPLRDLNPGPPAPKAGIIPLDQEATVVCLEYVTRKQMRRKSWAISLLKAIHCRHRLEWSECSPRASRMPQPDCRKDGEEMFNENQIEMSQFPNLAMQSTTVVLLACLVAVVVAEAHYEHNPSVDEVREALYGVPEHDHSPREKRGLLLLKKKLLLGALGLKAAKIGALGAAGVAGAVALKSKSGPPTKHVEIYGPPPHYVEVESWSG
ncbi:hypothetical protein K1T71_001799 [Dendrolimus kikuchii]|uniref:Uncharacterized protein n=1 Tax=Dendrolimus kikuchii TaxID=765133 RepID=A0ACC1DEY2_9NEOP|nr:hypothetical protein K1T71_001799 [Dendrolimus kikuchii]